MPDTPTERYNLLNYDRQGLQELLITLGEKPFRAAQLMQWIYQQGTTDFSRMSNLGKSLQARLGGIATIHTPEVASAHRSADGTWKWLFRIDSGNSIECVFIPEARRGTLCISTQAGCALNCSFCATARQGFNRNLSTAEIIGQLLLATRLLRQDDPANPRPISNIVLMGMGEPLANFNHVVRALRIMLDDLACGLSKRKITLSTSGMVPAMYRLYQAVDVALAVSLHAPTDSLRDQLVPINRKYPIRQLMEACRQYVRGDRKKHITFEYVMLAGINDQAEHARQLIRLLHNIPAKVNLIPFNPFTGSGYHCSSQAVIDRFRQTLCAAGLITITRKTRGDDINAACGQLAGNIQDKSKRIQPLTWLRLGEPIG